MIIKSIDFELKDLDKSSRTAIVAYSTYNNFDSDQDIVRKGAFTKSWKESAKDIRFFLNHDKNMVPGKPTEFFEDERHAYAKSYLGTHTLGEDVLKMMDEGIITNASFGALPVKGKANKIPGKGYEFKELILREYSVLTHWGANSESGVKSVSKELDINKLEKFVRNTSCSDETIQMVLKVIEDYRATEDNTVSTQDEPDASVKDGEVLIQLIKIKNTLK